jgi:D-alanine transaminase
MTALPDTPCYLNGHWLPLARASVSVLDRGFIFGDGVYEAVPAYNGRLFRFDEHMVRLARSLQHVRIANPHSRDQWLALMREQVRQASAANGAADQFLYLQVTRGVALREHAMPPDIAPTVFMMCNPFPHASERVRHHGVAAITARDFRWERGDIKTISLMGAVLARQISADQGAAETLLLREQANGAMVLTEGSASNAWVVHEGALIGPPASPHLLEGVRIELMHELCEDEGIAFNRRLITEGELRAADEVAISSAGREIQAVTMLDGEPVGHGALRGKIGPVTARLFEAYQRAKIEQSI